MRIKQALLGVLVAIALWLSIASAVFAATWSFSFPMTVSDNSGVARTYVPVLLGFGGNSLVSSGYTVNGLDTNMQEGTSNRTYMMDTANVLTVLPSLPANGSVNLNLYTGYSPAQTNFPIIVGNNGYVTTNDTAGLEWGASGTVQSSGYVNIIAGSNKNIVNKNLAFNLSVDNVTSGKINATIIGGGVGGTATIVTTGNGDVQDLTLVAGPTHWQAVLTNDGDATIVGKNNAGYLEDTYTTNATAGIPLNAQINSVTVSVVYRSLAGPAWLGYVKPSVRLNGVETIGAVYSDGTNVYVTASEALARPGGGSWSYNDLADLQIGTYVQGTALPSQTWVTQVYATISYNLSPTVSISGLNSGMHLVTASLAGGTLSLSVDSSSNTTSSGAVPDNANDWTWMQNNVMPYATYLTGNVTGLEVLRYQPSTMVSGTTLIDTHGVKNGDITWGANSNINITYGAMISSSVIISSGSTTNFTSLSVPVPSGWFAHGENLTSLPFYNVVADLSTSSGIPAQTFYFIPFFGLTFGLGLWIIMKSRSALIAVLAMTIIMFYGSAQSIVPGWIPYSFLIVDLGIMYLYRQITY